MIVAPLPPASRVTHRLWQGSVPSPSEALPFNVVVLCAEEHQFPEIGPRGFGDATILRCPLQDEPPSQGAVDRAMRMGLEVAARHTADQRVLVTCAMGMNRSGLVVGLALLALGTTAPGAVEAVRRARPGALFNPHFVKLIYDVAGRAMVRFPHATP